MPLEYNGQAWSICMTDEDEDNVFHAIFGEKKEGEDYYRDKTPASHRLNLYNFLSYYETKPVDQQSVKTMKERLAKEESIQPDDLVVIATLENIEIVLFKDLQTPPQVIKPNAELLDLYPLTNQTQLSTAVIFFHGKTYSKVLPWNIQKINEDIEVPQTFRRHPGYIAGLLYQINILTVVLLNAFEKRDTWRLSADNKDAFCFDDIVLEWGTSKHAFLLQAKVRQRDVSPTSLFGNKYSGFSLCKYFLGFEKLKRRYNVSTVVLCTNVKIKSLSQFKEYVDVDINPLDEADLLYLEGVDSLCTSFGERFARILLQHLKAYDCDDYEQQLITEENVKEFLKKLRLVYLPSNEKVLEQAIRNKVISMGLVEKYDSSDYARHLNKKITEWYDKSSQYLTPLDAKVIFSELKTDKITARLNKMEIDFKPDQLQLPTTKILHLIPQNDHVLTLLKAYKFLEKEKHTMLFLSTAECSRNQRLTADAYMTPKYSYLIVYIEKTVKEVKELYGRIVQALGELQSKRVILIGDCKEALAEHFKLYNEKIFGAVEDNVTFMDFDEKCQEELLKRAILFREASL